MRIGREAGEARFERRDGLGRPFAMREAWPLAKRGGGDFPQLVGKRAHFRSDEDGVDNARIGQRLGQLAVEGIGKVAQFLHGAEHSDPAGGRRCRQRGKGRAHRGGVGIVAFVDQQRRSAPGRDGVARAAAASADSTTMMRNRIVP